MPESGHCTSIINLTYKDGDEGSHSNPAKFNNQDYDQLKDKCRYSRTLFIDSTFPPENQSLGDLPSLDRWEEAQVQWLRPKVKPFEKESLEHNHSCPLNMTVSKTIMFVFHLFF